MVLQGNLKVDLGGDDEDTTRNTTTGLGLHRPPSMTSEDWQNMSKVPPPSYKMQPSTPGGQTYTSSVAMPNPKASYYAASSVPAHSLDDSHTGSMLPLPPVFGYAPHSDCLHCGTFKKQCPRSHLTPVNERVLRVL